MPEHGGAEGAESLHDVLEQAWSAAEERGEGEGGERRSPEGEGEGAPKAGEGEGEGAPKAGEGEGEGAPKAGEGEGKGAPVEAPTHWSTKDREMFSKIGADGQQWLLERYRGMEAAHTKRSQEIAPMRDLAQRWAPYFEHLKTPAPQAIDLLMQTEYQLRNGSNTQKIAILQRLVEDYGIAAPEEDENGNLIQPAAADPRIEALEQQIQAMRAGQSQQQQAEQQSRVAVASGQIQAFADEKRADGKLAYPYFGDVKNDMTRLAQADLAAGAQPDLKSLYDRAAWANPTVRAKLLAADNQEKARKASRAGGQVSGAGAAAAEQPKGLRETLEAEWARMSAA